MLFLFPSNSFEDIWIISSSIAEILPAIQSKNINTSDWGNKGNKNSIKPVILFPTVWSIPKVLYFINTIIIDEILIIAITKAQYETKICISIIGVEWKTKFQLAKVYVEFSLS